MTASDCKRGNPDGGSTDPNRVKDNSNRGWACKHYERDQDVWLTFTFKKPVAINNYMMVYGKDPDYDGNLANSSDQIEWSVIIKSAI